MTRTPHPTDDSPMTATERRMGFIFIATAFAICTVLALAGYAIATIGN